MSDQNDWLPENPVETGANAEETNGSDPDRADEEGSERAESGSFPDEYVGSADDEQISEPGSLTLREALDKYSIQLADEIVDQLTEYCELLWTWNERLNLTRHTAYDKFVSRDLVDAIRISKLLQSGEHVLDVGSGGGVPGLVVAILRPDVEIDLCESTGKKAEALGDMVEKLGLPVNVWYAKAEALLKERKFNTLTVRAVGKMRQLLLMFGQVWNSFDRLLMIKGPNWIAERGEARHYNMFNTLALRKLDEYEVPDADFVSVILQVCRKSKLDELQRREAMLAEGLPFPAEDDSEPEYQERRRTDRERSGRGVSREKAIVRGEERAFMNASDRRHGESGGGRGARVFARRNGKPPKGWAGKKSEFHADGKIQDRSTGKDRRQDGSRGNGFRRTGGGFGKPPRGGRRGGGK